MPKIAQESKEKKQGVTWAKVDETLLNKCFSILYPMIDPQAVSLTRIQICKMVEKAAKKKTPQEIVDSASKRFASREAALPQEYVTLAFPDGIQDVLNRTGSRIVVTDKYADTPEGRVKALTDLRARLDRLKLSLEAAKVKPIPEKATRKKGQRFDVIEFALDDPTAVPIGVAKVLTALVALDPATKFGKRKNGKAAVIVRMPELLGKFNLSISLPPDTVTTQPE